MSSDDFAIQNVYRYSRKSYKHSRNEPVLESYLVSPRVDANLDISETLPRNERVNTIPAGCSCDAGSEEEIAHILHRKCPVIALAQQQLLKLLDETDSLLCDNTRCCRSLFDLLQICKDAIWTQNKCNCIAILIIFCVFIIGLLLGAASCGVTFGKFNSPFLTCIDNYFISDTYAKIEDTYRGIV